MAISGCEGRPSDLAFKLCIEACGEIAACEEQAEIDALRAELAALDRGASRQGTAAAERQRAEIARLNNYYQSIGCERGPLAIFKHGAGGGRIWLGLTTSTVSLRSYATLGEIWGMVTRSADVQLRHSLLLLAATVIGMAWVYLLPPLAVVELPLAGLPVLAGLGALACILMAVAYAPTLRLYRLPLAWAATLPAAAGLYLAMTVDSAIRHRRGRGGLWKGRVARA